MTDAVFVLLEPVSADGWAAATSRHETGPSRSVSDLIDWLDARARSTRHRWLLATADLGMASPRRSSRVERTVQADAVAVRARFGASTDRRRPRFELDGRPERRRHAVELPARLHIPWSLPALRVTVAVEPGRGERSVVSVRLRSNRWRRTPQRYFAAALTAVADLA